MRDRPCLLLHCQHSLGLGHLVRTFALAAALADRFRVTVLCGGELPDTLPRPDGVEVVPLPSAHRGEVVLSVFRARRPAAVVVELFPFGRKKLAPELVPLLGTARDAGAVTAASVRDLLVTRDDGSHDERASLTANALLDAVLVHSDPRLFRFEESFRPCTRLRVPIHYTGYVVGAAPPRRERPGGPLRILVSAGGGRVGRPLLRAAADAHRLLADVETTLVAGPFLPEDEWRALPRGVPGLLLRRSVPDLAAELAAATVSVSQCGYNTALQVVRSGLPALVVPFAAPGEDEQSRRAAKLAGLGAVRALDPTALDAPRLAAEIRALLRFRPRPLALDLDGAAATTRILEDLVLSHTAVFA
jgi:predicted glycosyltransferase